MKLAIEEKIVLWLAKLLQRRLNVYSCHRAGKYCNNHYIIHVEGLHTCDECCKYYDKYNKTCRITLTEKELTRFIKAVEKVRK